MKKKAIIILAVISLLLVPMSFSETYGNISLQDWNQRIATGMWGITLPTTTSTTTTTATTTTVILTGGAGPAATTTIAATTTTTIRATTTSTVRQAEIITTAEGTYTIANAEKSVTTEEASAIIGSNLLLSSSIESLSGKPASSIDLKATEELSNSVSISKTLTTGMPSKLAITIIYLGEKDVSDFIIFDRIPKSFAQNIDLITINTNVKKSIVETDPSIAYFAPVMKKYDMIVIEYSVNSNVTQESLSQSETFVFTMGYSPQDIPLIWIILPLVIIGAIGVILVIFREQIPEIISGYGKKRKKPATGVSPKKSLKDFVEKLKNIILGKKESPKFVYKTEENK